MPHSTVRVKNSEGATATQLRLIFPATRTKFVGASAPSELGLVHPTGSELWVRLRHSLAAGESLELQVEYVGETPGRPAVNFPHEDTVEWSTASTADAGEMQWKAKADQTARDTRNEERRQRSERLSAYLGAHPNDPKGGALAYFWDLEQATARTYLLEDRRPDVNRQVEALEVVLRRRLMQRREYGARLAVPDAAALADLSALQLQIVRKHFARSASGHDGHGATPTFDVRAFEEAFILFATGQLWDTNDSLLWYCKPDSAYFFFFAEFALAAIEYGQDSREWAGILPVLVTAQPAYVTVFEPYCNRDDVRHRVDSGLLRFGSYSHHKPWSDCVIDAERELRRALKTAPRSVPVLTAMHLLQSHRAFPAGDGSPHDVCDLL